MEKQNLIYIHGLGVSAKQSKMLLAYINKRKFNVIAIGLPGSPSQKYKSLKTLPAYVKWLRGAIERLGLEQYSLIGASFGGLIANQYCETQKDENLKSVVCWATPFAGINDYIELSYNLFLKIEESKSIFEIINLIVQNLKAHGIVLSEQDLADLEQSDPRYMLNGIKIIKKRKPNFKGSEIKRLIITDPHDLFLKSETIDWIKLHTNKFKNIESKVIDHSGHLGNAQATKEANRLIEEFTA
jgi:pimeloyl-ACP methyl ester carboxylesterase